MLLQDIALNPYKLSFFCILVSRQYDIYIPILLYGLSLIVLSSFVSLSLNFERFSDRDTYDESRICQTLIVTPAELGGLPSVNLHKIAINQLYSSSII